MKIMNDDIMSDLSWLSTKLEEAATGFWHREDEHPFCGRVYKKLESLIAEIDTRYEQENEKAHRAEMKARAKRRAGEF